MMVSKFSECQECGATTLTENEEKHRAWHKRLDAVLDAIADAVEPLGRGV